MKIILISSLNNGSHDNQTIDGAILPPDGWAVIPEGMPIPDTFPFVGVEAENGVVTRLTPGVVPELEPEPAPAPTASEQLRADVDFLAAMAGVSL